MLGPIFISAVTFWGVALGGGLYWARRYVRAIEAKLGIRAEFEGLERRIRELETLPVANLASESKAALEPGSQLPPATSNGE